MLKLDDVKKLQQKKYRRQRGYFVLEGEHLITELFNARRRNPQLNRSQLLVTESSVEKLSDEILTTFEYQIIAERRMKQLSETASPQGMLAIVPLAAIEPTADSGGVSVYLHEIQDPGNLGTIIRTLGWFGGYRLLLSPGSVDPFNSKVLRSSMGAIFHLPIELDITLDVLSDRFQHPAVLDLSGAPLSAPDSTTRFTQHDCYIFGNEARGVPSQALEQLSATAYHIPGNGDIESLNLATSVSICAYQRQLGH